MGRGAPFGLGGLQIFINGTGESLLGLEGGGVPCSKKGKLILPVNVLVTTSTRGPTIMVGPEGKNFAMTLLRHDIPLEKCHSI